MSGHPKRTKQLQDTLHGTQVRDIARVEAAIYLDALEHDGAIDPNRVRALLTGPTSDGVRRLNLQQQRNFGLAFGQLLRYGLIRKSGHITNDATAGRRQGTESRAYRLTPNGRLIAGLDSPIDLLQRAFERSQTKKARRL